MSGNTITSFQDAQLDDEVDHIEPPDVPTVHMSDDEVANAAFEYSTRHPTDWVISGTLPGGGGPGRAFASWSLAEKWAREKYGNKFKARIKEASKSRTDDAGLVSGGRWAFLIKKLEAK